MSTKFKIHKWHIGTALAIALLSIADALYLWSESFHLPEAIHSAVVMALLLFLAELLVIIVLEQDEFLNYAKAVIERTASPMARFEDLVEKQSTHALLSLLGREAIRDFLRAHKHQERSCIVTGQHEALRTYLTFWQYLIEEQKKARRAIVVLVVHSLNIEIWRDEKMRAVLDKQGEFITEGGEIRRIVISSAKAEEAHLSVMKEMLDRRISVLFAQKGEFDHDFLVAPSLDVAVVWTGTVMARRIQRAEYIVGLSDDDKQAFRNMWDVAKLGATEASKIIGSRVEGIPA